MKFKLHRIIKDSSEQVVKGLTILPYLRGVRNKGLITQKNVNSTCIRVFSFQDEELKLLRNVDDSSGQVVKGLTVLPIPSRVQK